MDIEVKHHLDNINLTQSTSKETSLGKLGFCEVCALNNAKYTCPRCEVKTCSLKCNKIHKLEIECNGKRDRTKFIPLNKFSNLDLSSDYRLLEEISKSLESSKKNFSKNRNFLPHTLIKLRDAAKSRNINLKFLPFKFSRRKHNTTYFHQKDNKIYWHVEWVFVNEGNLRLYSQKVPETQKISSIFEKCISTEDEALKEKLQYYRSAGIAGIKFLLKAEQKVGKKFYELDTDMTLKECMEKKLIIEYPTIHVVLKDHGFGYNIIDSDDEEDFKMNNKVKSGNEVVNDLIIKAEKDENVHKSLKNLLFISEYSDEEISDCD